APPASAVAYPRDELPIDAFDRGVGVAVTVRALINRIEGLSDLCRVSLIDFTRRQIDFDLEPLSGMPQIGAALPSGRLRRVQLLVLFQCALRKRFVDLRNRRVTALL